MKQHYRPGNHAPSDTQVRMHEVFSRGASAAGSALQQLIGRPVGIELGRMAPVPYEAVFDGRFRADTPMAMVVLRVNEEYGGFLVLMMYEECALAVSSLMWSGLPGSQDVIHVDNVSALKELGNIVGSSFLNALADACKTEYRPSEPVFLYDMLAAVMQTLLVEQGIATDQISVIETFLNCTEEEIAMEFLFLPSPLLAPCLLEQGTDA